MYDYMYESEEAAAGLVAFYLVYLFLVLGISLAFSVISYVLQGKSMYAIAKRRGIEKPWLAWVPVGNVWMLGCISDQFRYVARGQEKNKRTVLMVLDIILIVMLIIFLVVFAGFISNMVNTVSYPYDSFSSDAEMSLMGSSVGMMFFAYAMLGAAIPASVLQYMALYDIFYSCEPSRSVLYLLLSIFIGYPMPFFLYACRNKDLGMPPKQEAQPQELPPTWEQPQ